MRQRRKVTISTVPRSFRIIPYFVFILLTLLASFDCFPKIVWAASFLAAHYDARLLDGFCGHAPPQNCPQTIPGDAKDLALPVRGVRSLDHVTVVHGESER